MRLRANDLCEAVNRQSVKLRSLLWGVACRNLLPRERCRPRVRQAVPFRLLIRCFSLKTNKKQIARFAPDDAARASFNSLPGLAPGIPESSALMSDLLRCDRAFNHERAML